MNFRTNFQKQRSPSEAVAVGAPLEAGETPKSENTNGGAAVVYRAKLPWDTTKVPLGHNARHTVRVCAINGNSEVTAITFQRSTLPTGWQAPYPSGPDAKSAQVSNLVITDVVTNAGNADYIKFDPDSADDSLRHPTISFRLKDDGDPHRYKWTVWIRRT